MRHPRGCLIFTGLGPQLADSLRPEAADMVLMTDERFHFIILQNYELFYRSGRINRCISFL